MREEILKPIENKDLQINPIAIIAMARQEIRATGSGDSEFEILNNLEERFLEGELSAQQVHEKVDQFLATRQDYH